MNLFEKYKNKILEDFYFFKKINGNNPINAEIVRFSS